MLTDAEQSAFLAAMAAVRARVAGQLQALPRGEQQIHFVSNLQRSVDRAVQAHSAPGRQPECAPACAYCCHVPVEAGEPELLIIAAQIKALPAEAYADFLANLAQRIAARAAGERSACVFLQNDLCSIYTLRPAVCRKAHSLSASACASGASEIPQDLELLLQAEAMIQGTAQGYVEAGLRFGAHELMAGLLRILRDEPAPPAA